MESMTRFTLHPLVSVRRFARLAPEVIPLLVGALFLLSISGCLSTNVSVRAAEGGERTASIRVGVFANADDAKANRFERDRTLVEIFRREKGGERFLGRSLASRWGIDALPPGDYRVKVAAVLDDEGNISDPRAGDRETSFRLGAGERAELRIILRKVPVGLIVIAAVTIVVLIVVAIVLVREGDIDLPNIPDPGGILNALPMFPPLDHIVFYGELPGGIDFGDGWTEGRRDLPPPRVTSAFPRQGSLVSASRIAATVTFSQPVRPSKIRNDSMKMLGSKSGIVRGRTVFEKGLLRFVPGGDLQAGETITVTVSGEDVENESGDEMGRDFSWTFRLAR